MFGLGEDARGIGVQGETFVRRGTHAADRRRRCAPGREPRNYTATSRAEQVVTVATMGVSSPEADPGGFDAPFMSVDVAARVSLCRQHLRIHILAGPLFSAFVPCPARFPRPPFSWFGSERPREFPTDAPLGNLQAHTRLHLLIRPEAASPAIINLFQAVVSVPFSFHCWLSNTASHHAIPNRVERCT